MQSISDPVWAKLAQRAIPRYSEIERESGKVAPSLLFFLMSAPVYTTYRMSESCHPILAFVWKRLS